MTSTIYDQIIEPFAECLTRETAQKIVDARAAEKTQARFDDLAEKANRGELTDSERAKYEQLRILWRIVSQIQIRGRELLRK